VIDCHKTKATNNHSLYITSICDSAERDTYMFFFWNKSGNLPGFV